jgi:hypothetical protein
LGTEPDPVKEKPSRRRHCGERREGHRSVHELVELLGGYRQLLKAADDLAFAIAKRHTELEATVLFDSFQKGKQYARASQLWDQALAVLHLRPFLLTPREHEAMLAQAMPVIRTAATLTVVDSFFFCRYDPLEVILQNLRGSKSAEACKSELVAERRARERHERPTRRSMFARVLMGSDEEPQVTDGWTVPSAYGTCSALIGARASRASCSGAQQEFRVGNGPAPNVRR